MKLPGGATQIIERLNAAGYRADVVGGSVRDALLGKTPGDYDITTSAPPEKIKEVFANERLIETGIKHGTVTVVLEGIAYEVTTYRIDGEYRDSRHPVSVLFTEKIENDLARRDFTVNAMAYNENDGLTDCYGGISDLNAGVIRTVGDAEVRFTEDALRILRALRFASTLDFIIENKTEDAIFKLSHNLKKISVERIMTEWGKLLSGKGALRILKEYTCVINQFLPELEKMILPAEEIWDAKSICEKELVLFALNADKNGFKSAMQRLKSDNRRMNFGYSVLDAYSSLSSCSEILISEQIIKYGKEVTTTAISIGTELNVIDERYLEDAEKFFESGLPYRLSMLNISGSDIMSLGIKGERVGVILNKLLHACAAGKCENLREKLLDFAGEMV